MEATQLPNDPMRPIRVTIACDGTQIVEVSQKDLFGKYGWPAEDTITEALEQFKMDRAFQS